MKTIKLKSIHLVNFKSFRDRTVNFDDRTTISGMNGLGKTTIFDGFMWALFGKDSKDRKKFDIKTLDNAGVAIPRIPHEVEVVLDVDGETVSIRRTYSEIWRKARNSASEEFSGHEEERFFNNVPLSVREFDEKVSSVIKEDLFRYVSDPLYFMSQKEDAQRELLFRMAGGVPDAEIIAKNKAFSDLFSAMGSKTIDEYEKEKKYDLSRIVKKKSELPARIDECKRMVSVSEDWDAVEKEVSEKVEELAKVDAALMDGKNAIDDALTKRSEVASKLSDAKIRRQNMALKLKESRANESAELKMQLRKAESEAEELAGKIDDCKKKIEICDKFGHELSKEREVLLEQYRSISAETFSNDGVNTTCPTCGRPYDDSEIALAESEMLERFNADKAARLAKNKEAGLKVRSEIDENNAKVAKLLSEMKEYEDSIPALNEKIDEIKVKLGNLEMSDEIPEGYFDALDAEIYALETNLSVAPSVTPDTELQARRDALNSEIYALKGRLAKRDIIEINRQRIAELETQLHDLGNEEATIEGILFTIDEFSKARSRAISDNVNSMFRLVRFNLFDTLINGKEKEICEASMNGVPYSVLSNGEKIVAGLDVIRAVCKNAGISAPIFIDNSESVSGYPDGLLEDMGQMVFLRVTEDAELKVSAGSEVQDKDTLF